MTGSSSWCGKTKRMALYIRGGFRCAGCDQDLRDASPRQMGLDHLEDLINGGGHTGANHTSSNLILVCVSCNSSRQDKPYTEFYAKFPGALDRIEVQRSAPVNMALARSIINGSAECADR